VAEKGLQKFIPNICMIESTLK